MKKKLYRKWFYDQFLFGLISVVPRLLIYWIY